MYGLGVKTNSSSSSLSERFLDATFALGSCHVVSHLPQEQN